MTEFLMFMRFLPEIRKLVVAIGDLVRAGKQEEAEELLKSFRLGQASGKAAHNASRNAGPRKSK